MKGLTCKLQVFLLLSKFAYLKLINKGQTLFYHIRGVLKNIRGLMEVFIERIEHK